MTLDIIRRCYLTCPPLSPLADLAEKLALVLDSSVFLAASHLTDVRQLEDAVRASTTMLVLATPHYLERPWCLLELWFASLHAVPVVILPFQNHGSWFAACANRIRALCGSLVLASRI